MAHAHEWRPRYNEGDPEVYPGTTGGTLSADVLSDLKTKGQTSLRASMGDDDPIGGMLKDLLGGAAGGFGKSTIRPESEPVLQEIADALAKNPNWKLSVEGHTDNIGGTAPNLDLSTRRAVAVRQALDSIVITSHRDV